MALLFAVRPEAPAPPLAEPPHYRSAVHCARWPAAPGLRPGRGGLRCEHIGDPDPGAGPGPPDRQRPGRHRRGLSAAAARRRGSDRAARRGRVTQAAFVTPTTIKEVYLVDIDTLRRAIAAGVFPTLEAAQAY